MPSRIGFRVAKVTSEEEGMRGSQLVEVGPQAKGWMSAKYCIFPQTLDLALDSRTRIERVQVLGHPWAVSTSVEIWVGDVPRGQEVDIAKAYFMKIGEFPMESNKDNDYIARQLQCLEINQGPKPLAVTFLRFILHKNHTNRKNQYNQVGFAAINIIGTPVDPAPGTDLGKSMKSALDGEGVLSEYDDISFLMYTDKEVAQIISKLEKKKFEAVATERFEYAKKIKSAIGELREAGLILGSLEMEKQIYADTGQYDEAKEKKIQMDDFRVEVYKSLEITDLLELQGLDTNNDRATVILDDRIDQHLYIVERNRKDLSNVVIFPKPPKSAIQAPDEFHYIEPNRGQTPVVEDDDPEEDDKDSGEEEASPPPPPSPKPPPPPVQKLITPPHSPKEVRPNGLRVPQKDENKLINAIAVFSEPLVAKVCFSKNVKEKLEAIEALKTQVDTFSAESTKQGKFFKATSEVLQYLLKTSIVGAFQAACTITDSLFKNVVEKFKISDKILAEYTKPIFSALLLRSGEANQRIYTPATDTMVTMVKTPRLEELDVLELLLTEKITVKEPPKVALSRVQFTKFLVESYGISEEKGDPMSVKHLAGFGVNAVQHQDPEVRAAGQELVLLLYRVDQEAVRKEMPEDNTRTRRSHATRHVFEKMEEYDKAHGHRRHRT